MSELARVSAAARLRLAGLVGLSLAGAAFAWQSATRQVGVAGVPPADAASARLALHHQPLDAAALRILALEPGRPPAQADRLLRLSAAVTRRDRETQVHLLEAHARAGDVTATLAHYDVLLSTTPELWGLLFGVLGRGLSDGGVRAGLARYRTRAWLVRLVHSAAGGAGDARQALALAREAGLLAAPATRNELAPALVSGLLAAGAVSEAAGVAEGLGLGDWRAMGFTAQTLDPRLGDLAWSLEAPGGASASLMAPGVLAVTAEPQRVARVARRLTAWPAGRYRLSHRIQAPSPPAAGLSWRVACTGRAGGALRLDPETPLPTGARDGTDTRGVVVTIPDGCPVQEWGLWAQGADSQTPSTSLVSSVSVGVL